MVLHDTKKQLTIMLISMQLNPVSLSKKYCHEIHKIFALKKTKFQKEQNIL